MQISIKRQFISNFTYIVCKKENILKKTQGDRQISRSAIILL